MTACKTELFAADWTAPSRIITPSYETGCYNKWPSLNGDGTRIAYLSVQGWPETQNDAKIRIVEYTDGSWRAPEILAANGHYSTESFQWLPWQTQPVISADGDTIAYAGYEYDTVLERDSAQIYIIDRQGGAWGAPAKLDTGIENHESIVSLSADGNTIAYVSRPFNIFGGTPVLHVSVRTGGVWGAKTAISSEDSGGAVHPSLSSDGTKLIWVQNEKIYFSEKRQGLWTPPIIIAANRYGESTLEYPLISSDGTMALYWKVNLTPTSGGYIRQTKDLYLIQRTPWGWSGERRINPAAIIPGFYVDGPAGASGLFNRVAYSRSRVIEDVMNGANLEMAELSGNNWAVKSLTGSADSIWDVFPAFSADGNTIIYQGSDPSVPGCNAFWAAKTTESNTAVVSTISGTVTFAGAPLPGVTVTLAGVTGAETTTDAAGRYGLTGFSDGSYTVTPSLSGFVFSPANKVVSIAGASAAGQDFSAANAAGTIAIFGSVLESSLYSTPQPFSGITIEVVGDETLKATSGSDGTFLLAGIPAKTDFALKLTASSPWYLPVYSAIYNAAANIREKRPFVIYGEAAFSQFNRYGGVAEGRLFRADDPYRPLEGAVVTCTSTVHPTDCTTAYRIAYRSGSTFGGTATSADGLYYIDNIEVGDTVTVTATKPGWQIPQATFTVRTEWQAGITEIITTAWPGDINGSGTVDLADAIAGLQIMSQKFPQTIDMAADINGDGRIGMAEVLFILQKTAQMR
jgi:hypothetical protein